MKTQRVLAKQIKKPQFLIGFEIEGGIDAFREDEYRKLLNSIYGLKWVRDDDGSLEFYDDIGGVDEIATVEFKTPALQEKEAFQNIFKAFNGLNDIGFFTNETCGFHVNISEKNIFQ